MKDLKPKIKLRELKAIQKGEQSFKKTLGRVQEYHEKNSEELKESLGSKAKISTPMDREMKKVMLLE